MISTKFFKQASVATAAGLIALSPLPSLAFAFQDDPGSGWTGNFATISETGPNNNTRLAEGFLAGNFSGPTRSLGFVVPFLWSRLPDSSNYAAMSWNNTLGGWFTNNFDSTSLLVTLANFPQRVAVGSIADLTGSQPLPLSSNCDPSASPSCSPFTPATFPVQTLQPTDTIPFLDLGVFSPDEVKPFDIAFQYQFGDNRTGTAFTTISGYTLAVVPTPALLPGLVGMGIAIIRKRKQVDDISEEA